MVNIGLEGQMILGTWGAAYFTYCYGPWVGIARRAPCSVPSAALLHALATVTFGVDHIVSGVAINIIGLGRGQFLAEAYFADLERRRRQAADRPRPADRASRSPACPTPLATWPTSTGSSISDMASRRWPR